MTLTVAKVLVLYVSHLSYTKDGDDANNVNGNKDGDSGGVNRTVLHYDGDDKK